MHEKYVLSITLLFALCLMLKNRVAHTPFFIYLQTPEGTCNHIEVLSGGSITGEVSAVRCTMGYEVVALFNLFVMIPVHLADEWKRE